MSTDQLLERIPPEVVSDLVALAWQTFVGEELVEVPLPTATPEPSAIICSSISIGGPWSATFLLHCSRDLAFASASAVLGLAPDELEQGDVDDILGELANIIGGNLKGIVSDDRGDWTLSLPVVSHAMQSVPGSRLAAELHFVGRGGDVGCQLREHA